MNKNCLGYDMGGGYYKLVQDIYFIVSEKI